MTTTNGYFVGAEIVDDVSKLPSDGFQWSLSEDGAELFVFVDAPTTDEVESVRTGSGRFALIAGDHALILAHRFGTMPWSDAPWQACRQIDRTAGLIDVPPGQRLPVLVLLVDSTTGILRAIRLGTWDAAFAVAVSAAIRRQLRNQSTNEQGAAEIAAWYREYPTPEALVERADIACRSSNVKRSN